MRVAHFLKDRRPLGIDGHTRRRRLRKRHGLQGPIDDAFMDSFLMVRPTGKALSAKVGNWTNTEMQHALDHWRRQFRGDARVANDNDVGAAEIAAHNLIIWGDPLQQFDPGKDGRQAACEVGRGSCGLGEQSFDAGHHVPVLIYPNPLNPKRYVVLNSGFTFREYDYLNNARQVPKLPDFAIVDINVPVSAGCREASWRPGSSRKPGTHRPLTSRVPNGVTNPERRRIVVKSSAIVAFLLLSSLAFSARDDAKRRKQTTSKGQHGNRSPPNLPGHRILTRSSRP